MATINNPSSDRVVIGLEGVVSTFKNLPLRLQRNVMRGALRAGANVIAEDARLRVPVRSGQLKASIRVASNFVNGVSMATVKAGSRYKVFSIGKSGRKTKRAYKTIGPSGKAQYHSAYYAHWVEFGTSKMPARAFMRPSFESKKEAAVEAVAQYIRERLSAELLSSKNGR